jgi:hypothetical protein
MSVTVNDSVSVTESSTILLSTPTLPAPGNTRFVDLLAAVRTENLQVGWSNIHA